MSAKKVIYKTLSQQKSEVDVYEGDTISIIKGRIAEQQSVDPANIKVVFSGKVLNDEKPFSEIKYKDKDFLVAMISKPKAAPKPAAEPAAPAASTSAAETPAQPAPAATEAPASAPAATVPAAAEPTPAAAPSDNSGFVTGSARESSIMNMMEMGFERAQVERALRAAFNNPERAAQYLFDGIPPGLDQPAPQAAALATSGASPASSAPATSSAPAAAPAAAAAAPSAGSRNLFEAAAAASNAPAAGGAAGAGAGGAATPERISELVSSPAFAQLRQVVRTNPQMLMPFLQTLSQSNPGLLNLINSNQEAFLQALQGDDGEGLDFGALGAGGEGGAGGGQYIQVTEEEQAAIGRLCELGFDRNDVIQAYLACDRNEELAASFLLEGGMNDDEGDMAP